MSRVCFTFLFMTLSPIQWADIVAQSFIGFYVKYESLEPLINLLAFLVQKLCQKFQTHEEFPRGFLQLIFGNFCHKFSTSNATKSIKPFKDSYYSLECWIRNTQWVIESCVGQVNLRRLWAPTFAWRVHEPALLCMWGRLNLLRDGYGLRNFFCG